MTAGAAIAAVMPEGAIVMDEAATTGLPFMAASMAAPPHTYLSLTGGAIGQTCRAQAVRPSPVPQGA